MVRHEELAQIREGYEDAEEILGNRVPKHSLPKRTAGSAPKITLIVCIKRHHARFYRDVEVTPKDLANRAYEHNLTNGTVADTVAVAPNQWSFYLQSHHSRLGTARSCLYVVLEDTAGYTPMEIQTVVSQTRRS